MPKTIKCYVYDNEKLSNGPKLSLQVGQAPDDLSVTLQRNRPKLVQHVTGETYIYFRGTAKRVVCNAEGQVVGAPSKLTKKQRRKVRAELKAKEIL